MDLDAIAEKARRGFTVTPDEALQLAQIAQAAVRVADVVIDAQDFLEDDQAEAADALLQALAEAGVEPTT